MNFKEVKRKGNAWVIPVLQYLQENNLEIKDLDVSLSRPDIELSINNLEEFQKGYIARNPENYEDKWYIAKDYFDKNFEDYTEINPNVVTKTLHNTTASGASKNVKDIVFWGNGDTFKLISKASSQNEGWMKSTKAMEIEGVGCVVQVTTQQRNPDGSYVIAEAITFAPNTKIKEQTEEVLGEVGQPNKVIVTSRKLVQLY